MTRRAPLALALAALLAVAGCGQGPTGPGTLRDATGVGLSEEIGDYELAFGPTVFSAEELVLAEDATNRPPAEGRQFVLAPMQLTYRGETVGEPWLDLDVRYVTAQGRLYGDDVTDECGALPGSLEWVDQMPPGTTAWGTVCASVPADEVPGGAWVARHGGTWGWYGFFAAATDEVDVPGSARKPHPIASEGLVGAYSASFGRSDPDAYAAIRAWDEQAEPPAEGRRYVLAPVTLTFAGGPSSGEPWGDLAFTFRAADGTEWGAAPEDWCGDIPEAIEYAGVLQAGSTVTGNVCVAVPDDLVEGGVWHVVPEGTALVWTGHFATS